MPRIKNNFYLLFLIFINLFIFEGVKEVKATGVNVGTAVRVVSPSNIHNVTNPITGALHPYIDAPLSTFVSGGVRYWFNSIGSNHQKYKGTLDAPFQTFLWDKSARSTFLDPGRLGIGGPWRKIDATNWSFDGKAPWIVNIYQVSDSELLAFVHLEEPKIVYGVHDTGRSSIGLAWSSNAGETFTYLGEIMTYQDPRPVYNAQGAPYFIKDGYFYVYYHDLCPGAATIPARAPVNEVIAAARSGRVSVWKKYYNGGFTSNGIGGLCSRINIGVGIDHTDAAYSTYTQKYYILLSMSAAAGRDSWINLFESADGINWNFLKTIVQETYTAGSTGYQYVNIVDATGKDNGQVGSSFYVYSAKDLGNPTVYRWLVNLTATSSTTAPLPTPTITPRPPTPPPTTSAKIGDVNSDNKVDIIDIGIVIDNYGRIPIPNLKADVNRDGSVNIIDIGMIIDNYGK
jgi:hypothetical protein